jgi:hypothetical protein
MRKTLAFAFPLLAAVAAAVAVPAAAKEKKKGAATLRYARSYAEAIAEAKDRNCVVFATFHSDT